MRKQEALYIEHIRKFQKKLTTLKERISEDQKGEIGNGLASRSSSVNSLQVDLSLGSAQEELSEMSERLARANAINGVSAFTLLADKICNIAVAYNQ